jgi:capsular polysaccharide transport system ATP-binding protein
MIELRGLTKSFRTVHGRHFVFRDLSLIFPDGINIGLIGPNGAGKSTLMRIIGGIDVPDHGTVITDQRISFPVGLSGGFQGTLSGRDNAKFVCRLYGVNPREVREKVGFVEEFAELGKYFDMPIKTYSSGMRSRLIFGLSMAFDFDYYLMDEVGAVGDAGFKAKSRELLEAKIGQANVICVSHNMGVIREQCDVAVLLRSGEAVYYEDIEEGIRAYQGDAYVQPAAEVVKRGGLKRVTPDNITPRLVRRARRIIRVARKSGLAGMLPAARPAETDQGQFSETPAADEAVANQRTSEPGTKRARRQSARRSRRRPAGAGQVANQADTVASADESGARSDAIAPARVAAGNPSIGAVPAKPKVRRAREPVATAGERSDRSHGGTLAGGETAGQRAKSRKKRQLAAAPATATPVESPLPGPVAPV